MKTPNIDPHKSVSLPCLETALDRHVSIDEL